MVAISPVVSLGNPFYGHVTGDGGPIRSTGGGGVVSPEIPRIRTNRRSKLFMSVVLRFFAVYIAACDCPRCIILPFTWGHGLDLPPPTPKDRQ